MRRGAAAGLQVDMQHACGPPAQEAVTVGPAAPGLSPPHAGALPLQVRRREGRVLLRLPELGHGLPPCQLRHNSGAVHGHRGVGEWAEAEAEAGCSTLEALPPWSLFKGDCMARNGEQAMTTRLMTHPFMSPPASGSI